MPSIKLFTTLQEIDSALDADRQQFSDNKSAMQPSAALQALAQQVKTLTGQVAHWTKERRERQDKVSALTTKIAAQEKKLYQGHIKDAREQVAMQQNIESLKRHLETLEESALEAMMALEDAEQQLQVTRGQFSEQKAAWQALKTKLEQDQQTLVSHAKQLKAQRAQVVATMPADDVNRYESLRKKMGGLAVVKLQGRTCGGCGASLPTFLVQKIHESKIAPCPICGRLLYD